MLEQLELARASWGSQDQDMGYHSAMLTMMATAMVVHDGISQR